MVELTITSMVATGNFDRQFDLEPLANDIESFSYDHSVADHPGLYVKFNEDGPTITIFRSGSCNIRGASSEEELYENKKLLQENISSLGLEETINNFQITNIVFTSDLEKNVDLNQISIKLGLENIEYEPEQFPGLVYRVNTGVILVFSSGKLVLTGFTKEKDAKQAFEILQSKLTDD
jgi:transcription initiation factor TFIID TATA-box-binding protein